MANTANSVEQILDSAMNLLLFSHEQRLNVPRDKSELFDLGVFDNIYLMDLGNERDTVFFTDVTPQVVWPVNQCVACFKEDKLQVAKLKTCPARDFRGFASIVPVHTAWLYHAHYFNNMETYREKIPVGFLGGHWRALDAGIIRHIGEKYVSRRINNPQIRREIADTCMLTLSAAFTTRYEWSVAFRIDTSPAIRFFTDPSGIKDLFKTRDRGNRSRRDALKHWVADHWRQHRVDPDAETYVRTHLRGSEHFRWCGYDCEVSVSAYDLEKQEEAKRMREGSAPQQFTRARR